MFIVLIYLCNLRSHLIKEDLEPSPNSIDELAGTKYSHKLHAWNNFEDRFFLKMKQEGRGVYFKGTLST